MNERIQHQPPFTRPPASVAGSLRVVFLVLTSFVLLPFFPCVAATPVKPRLTLPVELAGSPVGEPIVALLPPINLSGAPAPLDEIRLGIGRLLESRGLRLLPRSDLDEFMARHRMRYTGGMTPELGAAMRAETGATAVVVSSVDLYEPISPLRLALTVRLVSTDGRSRILWMRDVARSGNQAPGLFDRGMIRDLPKLLEKTLEDLGRGLDGYLDIAKAGSHRGDRARARLNSRKNKRLRPRTRHRLPVAPVEAGRPLRVAVIPFANDSPRRNADQIMMQHFVSHLVGLPGVQIVEPGVVRQALLRSRLIMERGGMSFPQAEILHALLDVDLVLAGTVMNYQDPGSTAAPQVDFAMRIIDTRSRQVVWTSVSFNRGDEGVVFFNVGRHYTAHAMASEMARKALAGILWNRPTGRR